MCSGIRYGVPDGLLNAVGVDWGTGEVLVRARGLLGGAGGRLKLVGRGAFRVLKYNPQALQIVLPSGDLLHRGVLVVPQLLKTISACPNFHLCASSQL